MTSAVDREVRDLSQFASASASDVLYAVRLAANGTATDGWLTPSQILNGLSIGDTTKAPAVYGGRFATDAASGQTSINYAGVDDALSKSTLWLRDRIFGTVTAAESLAPSRISPHKIIMTDNANDTNAVGVNALHILHIASGNGGASGNEGVRETLQARLQVSGQYGTTGYLALTPFQTISYSTSNQAGITGWDSSKNPDNYYRAGMFGGCLSTWLGSGATYFRDITGLELNWGVLSGASTFSKIGLNLVKVLNDVGSGTVDAGISMSQKDSINVGVPIGVGLQFGLETGHWPFQSTSTLIGAKKRGEGLSGVPSPETTLSASRGVDFRNVTFGTAAFASNGFSVLPAGGVKTDATAVASLPSAATVGAGTRMFVSDANATTFGTTVAGGGSNFVPVYSDGTNWKIG